VGPLCSSFSSQTSWVCTGPGTVFLRATRSPKRRASATGVCFPLHLILTNKLLRRLTAFKVAQQLQDSAG
jgi:hypothetical protein